MIGKATQIPRISEINVAVLGPIAGALSNRFSARASVMAGAFIYSVGLVCSGLAPDMPTLLVCFGLVQGRENAKPQTSYSRLVS